MGYFRDSEELTEEIRAALELFLSSPEGTAAASSAAERFADEAVVELTTFAPETKVTVDLRRRRVETREPAEGAEVRLRAEADALHDLMVDHMDAGQIARALEERRIQVVGSPRQLDALIVIAGAIGDCWRRSLEQRGRQDLLSTPEPPPAGDWSTERMDPELFVSEELAARRARNQRESIPG